MAIEGLGKPLRNFWSAVAMLMFFTILLVGLTISLWPASGARVVLSLAAIAGALGGVLRSFAYLLAFRSLSARERAQWWLEAIVGPVLGAVVGAGAYMVIAAGLVNSFDGVDHAGMYLVAVPLGALAIVAFGRLAEHGLLRSGLTRSGVLGTQPASTAPILERIDRLLEQRVADLTVTNFAGRAEATATSGNGGLSWLLCGAVHIREPHWQDDALELRCGRVGRK